MKDCTTENFSSEKQQWYEAKDGFRKVVGNSLSL